MTRTLAIGVVAALLNMTQGTQAPKLTLEEQRQVDTQLADRHLDAGLVVQSLKLDATPVKDVMAAIGAATGLTTRYDQKVPELDKSCTVNLVKTSLPDALDVVLAPNGLAFKVLTPKSIFVYSDTPANRRKYAQSIRTFPVVNGDVARITQLLLQQPVLSAADGIRPVVLTGRDSRTITVRATAAKMAEIEKFIAANDKR